MSHTQRTWTSGPNTAITWLNSIEADLTGAWNALDPGYGFYKLSSSPGAGATTFIVDRAPGILSANAGQFVIIDPFTTEAELRSVTGVSGNTLTVPALTYGHSSGDQVYLVSVAAQGNLIPWSWWGGKPNVNSADATNNVTAFNRLTNMIHDYGPAWGIFIDPGTFCVNDQLKPEKSQVMQGVSALSSEIRAVSGFPFDTTGAVAVIHPYRDGSPVLYEVGGPSGRWWFRNFSVNANNLTNGNGILSSPQQPDSTDNMRVQNCTGLYGMALQNVQYHDLRNVQFDNCATSMYLWDAAYVRVFNMNVTSPNGTVAVKLVGCNDSSFYGALLETVPTGGKIFSATGGSSRLGFYDIYTSGFSGGSTGDVFYINSADNPTGKCTYIITNARCNQNASTINFLNDVQRGITLDSDTETQRAIPFFTAHGDTAFGFLNTGPRYYGPAGYNGAEYGKGGPRDIMGSGTPEGAITAPVGSTYRRTNGGAATSFYVKESGTGNTGWVAK